MNLERKFLLVIIGSVVVPLIVLAIVLVLLVVGDPEDNRNLDTILLTRSMAKLEESGIPPDQVESFLRRAMPDVRCVVTEENPASPGQRMAGPEPIRRSVLLQTRMTGPDGRTYLVSASFTNLRDGHALVQITALLVMLGSLLAFTTVMSVIIVRSINRSISRLETATRRISEGDLDFRLEAVGNDRLALLTRSFDLMRQRVKEEAATRSRFILAISHDLKTPLSSITGYLDAIADGLVADPGRMERTLAIIRDKAGILEQRISQLIDFVKLETAEWKQACEPTRLADFLRECASTFAMEAEAARHPLAVEIGLPSDAWVAIDQDLVFRALENLIGNALRHADPGSAIGFTARADGQVVRIEISNRGEPIDPADLPFIWEPFFRGSKSRRETGFGLGLSVVKSVLASHGWQAEVQSGDRATVFRVIVPLTTTELVSGPPRAVERTNDSRD